MPLTGLDTQRLFSLVIPQNPNSIHLSNATIKLLVFSSRQIYKPAHLVLSENNDVADDDIDSVAQAGITIQLSDLRASNNQLVCCSVQ